jgi:hypothetical protein
MRIGEHSVRRSLRDAPGFSRPYRQSEFLNTETFPMPKSVTVTLEKKSYTWDGRGWYGTEDYLMPPLGTIHKLNALILKESPVKVTTPTPKRS